MKKTALLFAPAIALGALFASPASAPDLSDSEIKNVVSRSYQYVAMSINE